MQDVLYLLSFIFFKVNLDGIWIYSTGTALITLYIKGDQLIQATFKTTSLHRNFSSIRYV